MSPKFAIKFHCLTIDITDYMASWAKICDILEKYANRESEMAYQKSIIDLLLEMNLGWHKNQIEEQLQIQLGSTERLIPDVVIFKDSHNKFVMEVKKPDHVRTKKNIDQLVSYMKQLETPIGIYVGKELEVYCKNIGYGSEPKLLMSLDFSPEDEYGNDFLTLFSESEFSTDKVIEYLKANEEKKAFESKVNDLVSHFRSSDFQEELKLIIGAHFSNRGNDVVDKALEAVVFDIHSSCDDEEEMTDTRRNECKSDYVSRPSCKREKCKSKNKGIAQRYAYQLIKGIIEKNADLSFKGLYEIFGYKNYIEDIEKITDEKRWCMDEEDIIRISDGTRVVISNQWGFNNNCKIKMDRLREKASKFGLDTTLSLEMNKE